jgi:methionine sulfoxide reductase heme-binding subunit
VSALIQSAALWYASRATGIVALVLLSAVMALGIAVNMHGRLPGLPRFAVAGLHRSIALIAVLIPFTSSYLPLELGLGAVALDLLVAVVLTSLVRRRIGRTAWRGVHWLAYAACPVAVLHGYTSAKDLRSGALLALLASCVLAVAGAIGWRLIATTSWSIRAAGPKADARPSARRRQDVDELADAEDHAPDAERPESPGRHSPVRSETTQGQTIKILTHPAGEAAKIQDECDA